jgi:YidC/Oxa1 family membrane protein insertase
MACAGALPADAQDAVPDAQADRQQDLEIPLATDLVLGEDKPEDDAEFWIYAELSNRGGVVTRLQLNRYDNEDRNGPLILLQEEVADFHSFRLTTGLEPKLAETMWEVIENSPRKVVFRTQDRDGALEIEKRFSLKKNSPFIRLEVAIRNLSDVPQKAVSCSLSSGSGLPMENVESSGYFRNSLVAAADEDGKMSLTKSDSLDVGPGLRQQVVNSPVRFWGVDCQFFASVIIPRPGNAAQRIRVVESVADPHPDLLWNNIRVTATTASFDLQPGGEVVHEYLLFNGPKDYPLLDEHEEYDLRLLAEEGTFLFIPMKHIARPIDGVLRLVGSIIGDYGLALILTTVLIRISMLSLSKRQRRSAALMKFLQPKIKQLKEQYGKDNAGFSQAQVELFRKYNCKPLTGCLFGIVTGLLFIGVWRGLLGSFSLRQAELLWGITWIHDLSAPDRLMNLGQQVFLLGSHLNLLPFVALVLMFAGYRTDPSVDQTEKKKRFWGPVLFFLLCYTMPAASWLCFLTFIAGARVEQMIFPVLEFQDLEADETATAVEDEIFED